MDERRLVFPAAEIRAADADSRVLVGTVLSYGDVAVIRGGVRERFEPRAFEGRMADVILDVLHDRGRPIARTGSGLELLDSAAALELRADLPPSAAGTEALQLVRAGILRGLSVKFRAIREAMVAGERVIRTAQLLAVGIVDRPAYPRSTVEARRRAPEPEHWRRIPWL